MVTTFEFATATRVLFGQDRAAELAALAQPFGRRVLLVTGGKPGRVQKLIESFREQQFTVTILSVPGEPTIPLVETGAEQARSAQVDCVVSIGGGSVIDGGKAIAALATNRRAVLDYLEVIGKAQPLTETPLPFIAVPTTAGTGAEVTRNAVLHSPEHGVKVSLRSPLMLPRLALVDPELTWELPPALTASTGLDALTQLIEPFVSGRANAITDAICRAGIPRIAASLRRAFENGADAEARRDMSLGALFGGLALANAGLGAVHGLAAPLGGMFSAPHGALCAALLPDVMEANIRTAQELNATDTLRKYAEVSHLLSAGSDPRDGVNWVRALCCALNIPRLAALGIQRSDFEQLAKRAAHSSSMKGNPVPLTQAQLVAILERAS
ncbi:MAG TPA: iron-containing alcohol dehydrogenase [Methylomirabilota bacterium]|nr:iron-containing alcohol dehydrogenase [Methylomirabilota bacterium]